jgi:hypothetical protein
MKSWTGLHAERRIVLKLIASKTLSERLMIELRTAMVGLFEELQSWDQNLSLGVNVGI